MHWIMQRETDNGMALVVGAKIILGRYIEFAGRGKSVPEAKSKAMALMWRESRRSRNLPDDHVIVTRISQCKQGTC